MDHTSKDSLHTLCDTPGSLKHVATTSISTSAKATNYTNDTNGSATIFSSFATTSAYDCNDELDTAKSHYFDAGEEIASDDDASDAREHQSSCSLSSLPIKINDVHNMYSTYATNTKERFLIIFENDTNK